MKILLVDDENITIKLLENIIPWERLHLSLAGTAQDGEEALILAVKEKPDIIISDIRMSGMSGLELVEKISVLLPNTKVILMSAYADFGYVKEAMKYQCSAYILKPVDEKELEMTLVRVIKEIQGREEIQDIVRKSEHQRDIFELYKYMRYGNNLNKVLKYRNKYGFDFSDYTLLLIQWYNNSMTEYDNTNSMELIQENYVLRFLEQKIQEYCGSTFITFEYEEEMYLFLLKGSGESIYKICEKLVRELKDEMGLHIQACFSEKGHKVEELVELYQEVTSLGKYGFYIGDEQVIGSGYNCEAGKIDQVYRIGLLREAELAIDNQDMQRVEDIFEEVFKMSKEYYSEVLEDTYDFCYRILTKLEKHSRRYISYSELRKYHSMKELKAIMKKALQSIETEVPVAETTKYCKPIEESIRLIEKKYNRNLSLEEISAEIAVSKTYFCYLFKREVGMSVWNYLTKIRLDAAKKLLKDTEMKSYEVALRVGYDNPSYFSKLFKKMEGCTPNEYRTHQKEYSDIKA